MGKSNLIGQCLKTLRTPVYFLYAFSLPAYAQSIGTTKTADVIPASDMDRVTGEFKRIYAQAAETDRVWLENMMIRLHLLDGKGAQTREAQGLTDQDRALTQKRKDYRAELKQLGLDDDLSPNLKNEQKILAELFSGLGIDPAMADKVAGDKRHDLLVLIEKYYASGVDAANANRLGVHVSESHADVLNRLTALVGQLGATADVGARPEIISSRLDQSYREVPSPRYFEMRAEDARTGSSPVVSARSFLGRVSDEILSLGLRPAENTDLTPAKLTTVQRNDDSRLTASNQNLPVVPSPLPAIAPSIAPSAPAPASVTVPPSQDLTPAVAPSASNNVDNSVKMMGEVKSTAHQDSAANKNAVADQHDVIADHASAPSRTLASVQNAQIVDATSTAPAAQSDVAGAAAAAGAHDAAVAATAALTGGIGLGVAVSGADKIANSESGKTAAPTTGGAYFGAISDYIKTRPILQAAKSYVDTAKKKILGFFGLGGGSDDKVAKTDDKVAKTSESANSYAQTEAPTGDLLPKETSSASAPAASGDCRSAESDFLAANNAAQTQLSSDDQNTINQTITSISGSGGQLTATDWKTQFDSRLAAAVVKSPSLNSYRDAFEKAWANNENRNLGNKPCDDAANSQYRTQIAALGGNAAVTKTSDRAPASTDGDSDDAKVSKRGDSAKTAADDTKSASVAKDGSVGVNDDDSKPAAKDDAAPAAKPGLMTSVRSLAGAVGRGLGAMVPGHGTPAANASTTSSAAQASAPAKISTDVKSKTVVLRSTASSEQQKTCISKNPKNPVTATLAYNSVSCRGQFRDRFLSYVNGGEQFRADDYERCLGYESGNARDRLDRVQGVLFTANNECLFEGARPDPERTELRTFDLSNSCSQLHSLTDPQAEDKARIMTLNTLIDKVDGSAHDSSDSFKRFQSELVRNDAQAAFMKNLTSCTDKNEWGNFVLESERALRNASALACGSSEAFVVSYAFDKAQNAKVIDDFMSSDDKGRQEIYSRLSQGVSDLGKGHFNDDRRSTLLFDDMFKNQNQIAKSDCPRLVARYQFYLGLIMNSDLKHNWLRSMPLNGKAGADRHTASR